MSHQIDCGPTHLQTMEATRDGDDVIVRYHHGYGSRRAASLVARQYARDNGPGTRALFTGGMSTEQTTHGVTSVYRYRLTGATR